MVQRLPKKSNHREAPEQEPEGQEPPLALSRIYLEHVPEAYIHMAIAMLNLQHFGAEELREELERRDARAAFPDPSELLEAIDLLEERAREEAAASLGIEDDEPTSTEPPPSELDELAVLVDDKPKPPTE